jgi:hypothetical protein
MSHHSQHKHPGSPKSSKHIKWAALVVVILMLGAILIYVFTMDKAVVPGQPVPAAP